MLNIFGVSLAATAVGIATAVYYGGWKAMTLVIMLSVMEITLSFDNAIVNASILKDMEPKWRQRFLTWGIIIAVFGMRLVFPIVLVAFATHLNSLEVIDLALHNSAEYEKQLLASHGIIAAFGGMFLLMVFLGFILNHERDIYWLGLIEEKISKVGALESMEVVFAMIVLVILQSLVPPAERASILVSGISGVVTFVVIHSLSKYMNQLFMAKNMGKAITRAGFTSFLYLEVLDASFSFDGVIGAFAISKDIIIIMIGLGIGAFFVRSLTILLVQKRTLQNYIYLEHGAHYALGALALLMLASVKYHIPEVFIGTIGMVLILLSFISSLTHKNKRLSK